MVNFTFVYAAIRRGATSAVNTAIVASACPLDTAKRTVEPHVAADADGASRRWGRQTGPRPRPNAMLHSRMASGSHRCARAARFVMKRSQSGMPSALNISDTHITLWSRRKSAAAAQSPPRCGLRLQPLSCMRRGSFRRLLRAVGRLTQLLPYSPACAACGTCGQLRWLSLRAARAGGARRCSEC